MGETHTEARLWRCGAYSLDMRQPKIMGIVNTTPDSFSDGGQFFDASDALRHCEQLVCEGADILDIGAESSRPGAQPMPLDEELKRLQPVVTEAVKLGVPVSVDTYKPEVMQRALDWGASIINDIWAFRHDGALDAVAASACGLVLMHMHKEPQSMQVEPMQGDALADVVNFLQSRCDAAQQVGIEVERLCVDVGFGFGKRSPHNFTLLRDFPQLWQRDIPVLMGCSRKSSLGEVTGLPVDERLLPSVVAAVLSVQQGASVVRVHDVAATKAGLQVWQAVYDA